MTISTPMSPDRTATLRTMELEPWLHVGDPLAEAVIQVLRSEQKGMNDPLTALRELASQGDLDCIAFLRDVETPPQWVDFERMHLGGAMAHRYFPHYLVAMTYGGLMTTFCSADASFILSRTNRLERDVARRMYESAEMFFGVLDTDELRPGNRLWQVCVRVRLMHTMIRLSLTRRDAWPRPGQPISALQTAAGPLFFGAMIVERMRSLGAHIDPEEADGYYLIWRYVTRLLGVPPELLGDTAAEQAVLDARILPLAFDPDENSRRLAAALITGLTEMAGLERLPRRTHEVLARKMLGAERAEAMGISEHRVEARIVGGVTACLRPYTWAQQAPLARRITERQGRRLASGLVRMGLAGVPATYQP